MKALIRGRDTVLGTHEFKVHGLVRRAGGRGHRGGQDPAPVSAGELLRRTPRVDRSDRTHRPHADLRRAASAPSARGLRCALQHAASASSAATASIPPANACPRADPRQDPAPTGPRRTDQRVQTSGLKPLVRPHDRVLEPHRPTGTPCGSGAVICSAVGDEHGRSQASKRADDSHPLS